MYTNKGEIKYGIKEFEPEVIKKFERFLVYMGDDKMRTSSKYIYVLNKIPNELLDVETKEDLIKLKDWMIDEDVKTRREIKINKKKGAFQWKKNEVIANYALKKWLKYKNKQNLLLYLNEVKQKQKRRLTPDDIKIKNKNIKEILKALDVYCKERMKTSTNKQKAQRENDRDKLLVRFLRNTGGRIGETIQLETGDFNLDDLTFTPKKKTSKSKRNKTKNYSPEMAILLKEYFKKYCKREKRIFKFDCPGLKKSNIDKTYIETYKTMYSASVVGNMMRKIGIKCELPKKAITPHKFRHLLGKTLRERKVPLESIRDILGQDSLQSAEIYTDLGPQKSKEDYHKVMDEIGD